jgi:hypothetical protein
MLDLELLAGETVEMDWTEMAKDRGECGDPLYIPMNSTILRFVSSRI